MGNLSSFDMIYNGILWILSGIACWKTAQEKDLNLKWAVSLGFTFGPWALLVYVLIL